MPYVEMDALDFRILAELQANGRMSNQELSEKVGLSPSPCLRRLRHLEDRGIISRYVALVDPAAVGLSVTAFVRVRLDRQDDKHLEIFENMVSGFPEVMECYLMSGDADYHLRVLVGSLSEFETFLRAKLTKIAGVAEVKTSFGLRQVVYRTELPAQV
ncbi:Lrp/AsnC family transcriptional regulator [Sphingobium sp. TKS]|uniref:Lrp/AsnC family transcriptional regulator n=1 Tax=Sphingobium sp. TKS TaxID=1315974 RepID=UPI0007701457|nr:Lrp/AsnC family transcriptional regulator [Sphingobium sp. TKS]AMK25976.1 AsnC family transcriptional regulator [Sphingobium sp. TKS]